MLEITNNGYNNFDLAVSVTVSVSTVVGNGKTIKQLINILKNGGNAKLKAKVSNTQIELPNALGKTGNVLTLAGISDASGTATLYTGEFSMGTGANKDKLYLIMHSDTV
jgi:hypothetical protein